MDKIYTDEELKTLKFNQIIAAINSKMTEEEVEEMKGIEDVNARRTFLIGLYKKYISEAKASEEKAEEDEKEKETVIIPQHDEEVNLDISFMVDIRGVPGFNGTLSFGCMKLLVVAFRNAQTAAIQFKTPERAHQFIEIVKKVKVVEGVYGITDELRETVINKIKKTNMIA